MIPEPSTDERYYREAAHEMGIVWPPNHVIQLAVFSSIAQRAAVLKAADIARKPISTTDLLADLRLAGPQEFSVVLNFLADRVYEARLKDGRRLRDAMDFKQWLEELAEEARKPV